ASISGGGRLTLREHSGLSGGVRVYTATDDFKDWGFGNCTIPEGYRNVRRMDIYIDRFAIIGANSVILPGVTIGEGVSVGACSVVTRDLAPWGIYIGNKRVGDRNKDGVLKTYERFLAESRK
ncbi:acetyltransferase, partial [Candidatus Magnetobacterium bavaricum]